MLELGQYNRLKVVDEVDFGLYLQADDKEILLPKRYVTEDMKLGDEVVVFVYRDSEDRLIATTERPNGVVDTFAAMKVKEVTDFGAWLDWGLTKDLLVPHRQMVRPLQEGKTVVVRVLLDDISDRIIASAKLRPFFNKNTTELNVGLRVNCLVYNVTEFGAMVIIDNEYCGMIHKSELEGFIEIGTEYSCFVKKIHEDGKVDLSFVPADSQSRYEAKGDILKMLEANEGFLPYNDKSSPEDIKEHFDMSKKTFKRFIGNLYKAGKILITQDGISLKK